jgi:hypothetical protein
MGAGGGKRQTKDESLHMPSSFIWAADSAMVSSEERNEATWTNIPSSVHPSRHLIFSLYGRKAEEFIRPIFAS